MFILDFEFHIHLPSIILINYILFILISIYNSIIDNYKDNIIIIV